MHCFKAGRTSHTLCRRCSTSTSCAASAALRTETHSTGRIPVGCLNDPLMRAAHTPILSSSRQLSDTWFAYGPPPTLPDTNVAVEQRIFGLPYQHGERGPTNILAGAVNGSKPQSHL